MALTEDEEIAQWDELLKDRYTDKDVGYTEHVAKVRGDPPVVERWNPRGGNRNRGGRNDRRFDRRGNGDRFNDRPRERFNERTRERSRSPNDRRQGSGDRGGGGSPRRYDRRDRY